MSKVMYSNTAIIKELRRVFVENGEKPFTRREYDRCGYISKTTVESRFGTWSAALKKAGLYGRFQKAKKKKKVASRSQQSH
jgi:hypothetical protein